MKRRTFGHWLAGGGVAALGAAAGGCAAPVPVPGLAPGPALVLQRPGYTEDVLGDHGLTLMVASRPGLPLVSVALLVRCGPAFDPPGRRGASELMAQLLTRGALRRGRPVDGAGLARQAEALGGAVSLRVEDRLTVLEMTVLAPRAGEALALLSDLLRNPMFAAADLQAVRAQMGDALALRMQDPAQLAALVARRTAWGADPQGRVTTPDSLVALRRADVVAQHRRWVRPDRVAVVLAGDLDALQAQALVRPVLGDWLRPVEPPMADPTEPPSLPTALLLPQTLLLHLPAAEQTSVLVCAPLVGTEAPDHPAGTLAAAVVGAGYSARLNQEVRIRRGLSYGVTGRVEQQRLTGLFLASAQTSHAHAAEVAALMRVQLLALVREPVAAAELAARRAALVGALARQLDTTSGIVLRLGEDWAQGSSPAHLARVSERLAAVRPAQVQAFAQRHWAPERLRTVIAGPIERVFAAAPLPAGALRLVAATLDLGQPTLVR